MKRVLVSLLALAMLLAGCGGAKGTENASKTTAGAPAAEQKPEAKPAPAAPKPAKIKFAYAVTEPDISDLGIWIAKDDGLFEKEGLDVQFMMLNGDTLALQALVSGEADIAEFANSTAYAGIQKGTAIKLFLETTPVHDYMMVASPNINSLSDLKGKSLGVASPGSISYYLPMLALKKAGVDPKGVEFVSVGGSGDRAKALLAGKIQAGIQHVVYALNSTVDGKAKIIANLAVEMPQFQFMGITAKEEYLKNNRDVALRFTRAVLQGTRIAAQDKEKAVATYLKNVKSGNAKIVGEAYDATKKANAFGINGGMSKESFDFTVGQLVEYKELSAPVTYDKVYDTSIVKDVLKEIGTK